VSTFQNWSALFTTFIEGASMDFSSENLTLLGASLGRLHKLTERVMTGSAAPLLPASRFQLASAIPYALGQLLPEAHRVPMEVWPLYSGLIATLHRIQQTINLPITIVHGNSWPHNAIYTANDEVVLTNWKSAGVGPAILDVSYLLLISHLKNPDLYGQATLSARFTLDLIQPDAQAIAAIVRGYCQQRTLTTYEHGMLLDAVRFGIAFHAAQHLPAILHGYWRESVRLKTLQACYNASADIASLALQCFEQEPARSP
jgi:Ser/Thr protein kinase RdoA (MazF antagonist)